MAIIISFGVGNEAAKQVNEFPDTNSIANSQDLAVFLGYPPNPAQLDFRVNGSMIAGNKSLHEGDSVEIITKANEKQHAFLRLAV